MNNMEENKKEDYSPSAIETHPWAPFIPDGAKVLVMGTFPPGAHRWSMDFYYPNRTNDFWFMVGLIFLGDPKALYDADSRCFRLEDIKQLCREKGIALHDTCRRIRRLRGNASDKYLEVEEPVDLDALLSRMPECRNIATTGEKAAAVIAGITGTSAPGMGEMTPAPLSVLPSFSGSDAILNIWRMPSTSRAYPMKLEFKADFYRRLFRHAGIL